MNFDKDVKLHKDLKKHVQEINGMTVIHHPLVVQVPYFEQMNDFINKQYEQKLKLIQKREDEKDWSGYLVLTERPYRLQAFLEIYTKLKVKEFNELLTYIWTDSESPYINLEVWINLFKKSKQRYLMDKEEKEIFSKMPEKIKIYRGQKRGKIDGISWTINKKQARWFADRFNKDGIVKEKTIDKKDVIAYLESRDESEIIYIDKSL